MKADRALLTIGGEILAVIGEASTVSDLWERVRLGRARRTEASPLAFDWFVLALSLLYAIQPIDMREGMVVRNTAR